MITEIEDNKQHLSPYRMYFMIDKESKLAYRLVCTNVANYEWNIVCLTTPFTLKVSYKEISELYKHFRIYEVDSKKEDTDKIYKLMLNL